MKKILISTVLTALILSGCSNTNGVLDGYATDPSPQKVDYNDSFAMQLMKSAFVNLPDGLKDSKIKASELNTDRVGTSSMVGLGFLAGGGIGALRGLGWSMLINAGGEPDSKFVYYVAYVPADDINIDESKKVEQYVRDNYLAPAMDAYMDSEESKIIDPPAEIISNVDNVYKLKGAQCIPTLKKTHERHLYCDDPFEMVVANRYATIDKGMPFTPSVKADRYIVVRIVDTSLTSLAVAKNIKTDMIYAYIPSIEPYYSEIANKIHPDMLKKFPYIMGKDKATYPFVKIIDDQ